MSIEREIRIPIRLEEADVYRALVALRFGALRWVVILVSCVITAFILLFVIVLPQSQSVHNSHNVILNSVPLLGVVVAVGVTILVAPYFQARSFMKSPKAQEENRYTFTASGCRIEGPNGSSDLKWAFFLSARETKGLFLLYPQKNIVHILPKRSFAVESDIQTFRDLLRQNISKVSLSG